MHDQHRSALVELENIALRRLMLLYTMSTDGADRYAVGRKLAGCMVLIPVFRNAEDPAGMSALASLYKHDTGDVLDAYTAVSLIPARCKAAGVIYYPLARLTAEIITHGGISALRVDPGTAHGVGYRFRDGGFSLFRLKA